MILCRFLEILCRVFRSFADSSSSSSSSSFSSPSLCVWECRDIAQCLLLMLSFLDFTIAANSLWQVVVRMRPLNNKEEAEEATNVVQKLSSNSVLISEQQFTFDAVIGEDASQVLKHFTFSLFHSLSPPSLAILVHTDLAILIHTKLAILIQTELAILVVNRELAVLFWASSSETIGIGSEETELLVHQF